MSKIRNPFFMGFVLIFISSLVVSDAPNAHSERHVSNIASSSHAQKIDPEVKAELPQK